MQGVQLRSHSICVRCHASQQQPQRAAPRRSAAGKRSPWLLLPSVGLASPAVAASTSQLPAKAPTNIPFDIDGPTLDPSIVDQVVGAAIDAIKAGGSVAKQGLAAAGQGLGVAKQAYSKAAPVLKEAADAAAPVVKTAANAAQAVAKPALDAVEPTLKGGFQEVERFLTGQGLNTNLVANKVSQAGTVAGKAFETAKPSVTSAASEASSLSPSALGQYALIALGVWFLGPPVARGLFGSLRGYRGDISPAAALDAVTNQRNTVIVDIRTASEKDSAGVPDLPSGGKLIEVQFADIGDRRVRGQLKDPSAIERKVTAMQIAALKRIGKSSTVLLLDKNGGTAKAIARELASRGFSKVFVIQGGFSGWTSSKLQTRYTSSVSAAEVLAPLFGTRSTSSKAQRKALPSGR
eukprot:jgi/Astpho2/3777/Aster-08335